MADDRIKLGTDLKPTDMQKARTASTAQRINEYGRSLLSQLFMLIRTVRTHDINNAAFDRPMQNLVQTVNTLIAIEGKIVINAVEGQMYINDYKIKGDRQQQANMLTLAKEFEQRKIGGFTISKPVDAASMKRFVFVFVKNDTVEEGVNGVETMSQAISDERLIAFMINNIRRWDEDDGDKKHLIDRRVYAMQTYLKTLLAVKPIMGGQAPRAAEKLKTYRLVQDLVDVARDDDHFFLGLTTIKNYDDYLYNHSVNVCVLSIAFGMRIGLSKRLLSELGMAALFHDIGMVKLPLELLNKRGRYEQDEREAMQRHTIIACKEMLGKKNLSDQAIRRVLVAYEHHLDYNVGGYPRVRRGRRIHLFSRIVEIVDAFDSMTTAKPYREAFLPDEALKIMLKEAGTKFDPVLIKIFVNMVGVFPLGTCVELNTGEVALVFHNSNDPAKFDRPRVKLLLDADGNKLKPRIVDLGEAGANGGYKRTIVRSVDPSKLNLNVPNYLLGGTLEPGVTA